MVQSRESDDAATIWLVVRIALGAVAGLCLFVSGCMYVQPQYQVWHQHMEGKAELAKAEFSKQVMVQEAMAKLESSKSLASAEIERARGVAEANRIIGQSLQNNEGYLHYLWIHNLEGNQNVVYIPTEAGLPIFEAGGRFQAKIGRERLTAP